MTVQLPLSESALAPDTQSKAEAREIAPDLAYRRLKIVNVVFLGQPGANNDWLLIDTGLPGSKSDIVAVAEERFGKGARPRAILLTHGHFDHIGTVEDLAAEWDVDVYAHPLEHPYLDGTLSYPPADTEAGGGLMTLLAPLFPRSPIDLGKRLKLLPDDGSVPFTEGWRWIATPGHTPGHVSLWRESDRTLIAGDAFVTTGQESIYEAATQKPEMHGPPRYFTPDWNAAEVSVKTLAGLEPELAVSGHGRAVKGSVMREALHRLALEFRKVAVPEHLR
jgi:glyoxylase-like metal-dependent hydrolase (beta-lactamase superfamily II)